MVRLRRFTRPVALLLSSGAFLLSTYTHAAERDEARRHYRVGMEELKKGNYEKGIEELKLAYEILPHRNVLYNIARAYAGSGDFENAVLYYRRYLEENPPDKESVEKVLRTLEVRLAKAKAAAAAAAAAVTEPTPGSGTDTDPKNSSTSGAKTSTGQSGTPTKIDNKSNNKTDKTKKTPLELTPEKPGKDLGEVKEEDVFEEKVVTASRGERSPLDTPSSTAVITEQDIRLSGVTMVPELLRRVAGIDFAQITSGDYNLSMRGFNGRLANKLLVLINGRSVYFDFLAATFWESIQVEDIQRIEIVRGPGSALYGANAFAGVVNIITKTPGEGKSGVRVGFGSQNGAPGSVYHGSTWVTGRAGEWAFRMSAGYDRMPRFSRETSAKRIDIGYYNSDPELGTEVSKINAYFTRRIGKDVNLFLSGGYANLYRNFTGVGSFLDAASTGRQGDITFNVTSKNINWRSFWNFQELTASPYTYYIGDPSTRTGISAHVFNTELEYVTLLKHNEDFEHDIHIGASYRFKTLQWNYLNTARLTEHHYAAFAQDSLKIGEKFIVVGSMRGDYHPYLDRVIPSPRGSVIFKRTKQDAFRASFGSAFRTPSFLEQYLDRPVTTPTTGAEVLSQSFRADQTSFRLQPETIITTEVGYQNQQSDYYHFELSAYYNRVTDIIGIDRPRAITPSTVASGAPVGYNDNTGRFGAAGTGFSNDCLKYDVFGGELGVRAFPVTGLDLYATYALNYVREKTDACQGRTPTGDQRTSQHKITAGAQVRTKVGFDGSLDLWWTSKQVWAEQFTNFVTRELEYQQFPLTLPPIVNARVAYRFKKDALELSAVAFNLFNSIHREHPFGQRIGRRALMMATYRF